MKSLQYILAIVFSLAITLSYAQDTYTWFGSGDTNWNNPNNWRDANNMISSFPKADDNVIFLGSTSVILNLQGVTNVKYLTLETGANIGFETTGTGISFYLDSLTVEEGAYFSCSSLNPIIFVIKEKADIFGTISLNKSNTIEAQKIVGNNTGLVFFSGAIFTEATAYDINNSPFVNSAEVLFEDGSIYEHYAGMSPFGFSPDNVDVTFAPESIYKIHLGESDIYNFNTREKTYGHIESYVHGTSLHFSDGIDNDFSFSSFTNFGDEITIQNKTCVIKGEGIFANSAKINLMTEKLILLSDNVTFGGNYDINFEILNSPTSNFEFIPENTTLTLETDIRLIDITDDFFLICKGTLDCGINSIYTTTDQGIQLKFEETANSAPAFITANPDGVAGSIDNKFDKFKFGELTTFIFNGTQAQNTGANTAATDIIAKNVYIQNAEGVTLNRDIIINGTLYLDEGFLDINDKHLALTYIEYTNGKFIGGINSKLTLNENTELIFEENTSLLNSLYIQNNSNVSFRNNYLEIYNNLNLSGKLFISDNQSLILKADALTVGGINDGYITMSQLATIQAEFNGISDSVNPKLIPIGNEIDNNLYTSVEIESTEENIFTINVTHNEVLSSGYIGDQLDTDEIVNVTYDISPPEDNTYLYDITFEWTDELKGSSFDNTMSNISNYNTETGEWEILESSSSLFNSQKLQNTTAKGLFMINSHSSERPTSSDNQILIKEDYVFPRSDFSATANKIKIIELTAEGVLYYKNIDNVELPVLKNQEFFMGELDEGRLIYKPNAGTPITTLTSFLFKINDGFLYSNNESKFTIEIENQKQEETDIVISNYISPNGDGYNDSWIIQNSENLIDADIFIYDNYGRTIFKSKGYQNPWDGTKGGTKLEAGVYYYVIQLSDKKLNGVITLNY